MYIENDGCVYTHTHMSFLSIRSSMAVSDKNKQWFSSVSIVLMKPINELYSYTLITVGYFGLKVSLLYY